MSETFLIQTLNPIAQLTMSKKVKVAPTLVFINNFQCCICIRFYTQSSQIVFYYHVG